MSQPSTMFDETADNTEQLNNRDEDNNNDKAINTEKYNSNNNSTTINIGTDMYANHLKMNALLNDAYEMVQMYIAPNADHSADHDPHIPLDVLNTAKGIIFSRSWKGGAIVSGSKGSGILISRCNEDWSGPCAISIQGLSIGLGIGFEKIDCIFLLHDDLAFRLFKDKGAFHIGVSNEIATLSNDDNNDKNKNFVKNQISKSISSYSFSKGAYISLSIEGLIITIKDDYNEEYYGKEVTAMDIIYNKIICPNNTQYSQLISLFKQYHTA